MRRAIRALTAVLFLSASLWANGLSLNSIGPRALGMGGAVIGLANDYSTIYWNPAGLRNLNGVFVGGYFSGVMPTGSYKLDLSALGAGTIDTETKSNLYPSPGLMAHWVCLLTDKLTIGLGAYVPAGLGAEWNGDDLVALSGGQSFNWMSKIGVVNFSPAVAYQVADNFSLGLALNVYYALFDMERPAEVAANTFVQYKESSTGLGYGVTLGAHFKVNDMIRLGASFRTKTDVSMSGEAENPAFAAYNAPKSDFNRDVSWPLWVGAGVAVKPIDKLTVTFDVQYSQWSESEKEFDTEYKNSVWDQNIPAEDKKFTLLWKDATQYRVGVEYQATDMLALRAGYYTDPAPGPDETYNILFPSVDYQSVTYGLSFKMDKLVIDAGGEYLMGSERTIEYGAYADAMPGTHNMNIFAFSIGLGYQIK
ncbi:MAG: hypothetical protein D6677_04865 [Calditrichaeota bacterium]|nr:MAG: hypothetical protein D6677_04865 [Calditrichota bacterium]